MKATLIHHQGFGDLFTNNGLCNYYGEKYDELVIFTYTESRKKVIEYMYQDSDKIKCVIPKLHNNFDGNSTCLNCMTNGGPSLCPRDHVKKCEYIDYTDFEGYDNIKVGSFKDFKDWENFNRNNFSFSHSFYLYNGLDLSTRIDKFNVSRNLEIEEYQYNLLGGAGYTLIHEDSKRGILIDRDNIKDRSNTIHNLDGKSDIMVDQIKVIENASEIHLIDSSYSVLIYFLSFHNEKIRQIPKFLYRHPYNRDYNIYRLPIADNWNFINC